MIHVELPEPPSLNKIWRRVGNRTVLSVSGRRYRQAVAAHCTVARVRPISGPVRVTITWRRARRSGDLDNRAKTILDALTGYAFTDDAQVVELHMYRVDDRENPGASVEIEAATDARRKRAA